MKEPNLAALRAAAGELPAPSDTAAPRPPAPGGQPYPAGAAAWCYEQHTRRHGPPPAPGAGHNTWLAALTKFWNESGAPLADALALALATAPAGHDAGKITATVRGIYKREASAHGSKPYTAPRPGRRSQVETPPPLPPTFPAALYDDLPDFLRRCCQPFEGHEKAVMLLGALAVLSGCFPGVGGTYGERRYYLNLYVFIIAPAASGKGTLSWAQRLARPWHRRLLHENQCAMARYADDLAANRAAGKKAGPAPVEPPRRLLFLPGDATAAALIGALAENDGRGIICENEADTLTTALGAEHGKFADKLCKIFQHEPITLIRKTDKLYIELERPAVSIALTGTPGQLPRLIPTAENGLASRILFYKFSQPYVWKSGRPTGRPPLDTYFDELGAELSQMIERTPRPGKNGELGVEFTLDTDAFNCLDEAGAAGLAESVAAAGEAGASTAFRLGQIAFRIAGLLTVLRCFENGEAPAGTVEADAADVSTALAIVDTLRPHALAVLESLPAAGGSKGSKFGPKAEQESRARELQSQGLSIRQIEEQTGVAKSTVARWLS